MRNEGPVGGFNKDADDDVQKCRDWLVSTPDHTSQYSLGSKGLVDGERQSWRFLVAVLNALPTLGKMLFTAAPRPPPAPGSTSFHSPGNGTYPTTARVKT